MFDGTHAIHALRVISPLWSYHNGCRWADLICYVIRFDFVPFRSQMLCWYTTVSALQERNRMRTAPFKCCWNKSTKIKDALRFVKTPDGCVYQEFMERSMPNGNRSSFWMVLTENKIRNHFNKFHCHVYGLKWEY